VHPDGIRVDAFLLADAAQVVGAKLSLLGGGWNNLFVRSPDRVVPLIAVAGRIVVPLEDAESILHFTIQLHDETEKPIIEQPPRLTIAGVKEDEFSGGPEFAIPFAVDLFGLQFPQPGNYTFVLTLEKKELARTSFQVRFRF
jgi:hypothetical protein